MNSSFTNFANILTGLSKVLRVANQVVPIYKEVKPMVGNFRNLSKIVKEFNKSSTKSKSNSNTKVLSQKKELNNNPVFFQ